MTVTHRTAEYLFTKDLAAHLVYAEARHFTGTMSIHGPSEAELQTLTRKLSWLIDRDLNWCEVDTIVSYARELRAVAAGTHELLDLNTAGTVDNTGQVTAWITAPLFGEIGFLVAGVPTRWELAA